MQPVIQVVTTFSREGYQAYGKRCLETFTKLWPDCARMTAQVEDDPATYDHFPRVKYVSVVSPWREWIAGHKNDPVKNGRGHPSGEYKFRLDAVRFSYKVAALCTMFSASEVRGADFLVWLDADVLTFDKVPVSLVPRLVGSTSMAYLGRDDKSSETGFVAFDYSDAQTAQFIEVYEETYLTGAIFKLKEWHDGFVFDFVRELTRIPSTNLSMNLPLAARGHPFINSELGRYMDHLKGAKRKQAGHSDSQALVVEHPGVDYWRTSR